MLLFKLSSPHSYMTDGKTKSILDRKITFLGLVAIIAALATTTISFSGGTAFAYTEDDPAVVYSCFETNEDGTYVTETDEEGNVNLVPCPIDHGDNAWMLTSSALVLMMTPAGLAFFYGGLSRQKNAVNSLHMVFITTGVVAVQFTLIGYSLAFGPDAGGGGIFMSVLLGGVVNVFDVFC